MLNPTGQDALIVVDMQHDFIEGTLAVKEASEIIEPINSMIEKFHNVVLTQDWHPGGHISFASTHGEQPFTTKTFPKSETSKGFQQELWPDHCVAGSKGAELSYFLLGSVPQVQMILRKGTNVNRDSYSAFFEGADGSGMRKSTGLKDALRARGIKNLYVCGLALDFCVRHTAVDAVSYFDDVYVITPACRSVFPEKDSATKAELVSAGVNLTEEM